MADKIQTLTWSEPIGVEAVTAAVYAQRAEAPTMPELMSAAEIAEELGVTGQRVHQLRNTRGFRRRWPTFGAVLCGDAAAVRKFDREWSRKPGRPSNVHWEVKFSQPDPANPGKWQDVLVGQQSEAIARHFYADAERVAPQRGYRVVMLLRNGDIVERWDRANNEARLSG
ncbi:hypothetical protein [Mycolicibacterium sp. NCC-Tsukiji]|uniref:hypothetical protein n=1 Tax=Mycolicibacterium sp. NCC-Tsukiji TaxID=2185272 RepID=UPI001FCED1AF